MGQVFFPVGLNRLGNGHDGIVITRVTFFFKYLNSRPYGKVFPQSTISFSTQFTFFPRGGGHDVKKGGALKIGYEELGKRPFLLLIVV